MARLVPPGPKTRARDVTVRGDYWCYGSEFIGHEQPLYGVTDMSDAPVDPQVEPLYDDGTRGWYPKTYADRVKNGAFSSRVAFTFNLMLGAPQGNYSRTYIAGVYARLFGWREIAPMKWAPEDASCASDCNPYIFALVVHLRIYQYCPGAPFVHVVIRYDADGKITPQGVHVGGRTVYADAHDPFPPPFVPDHYRHLLFSKGAALPLPPSLYWLQRPKRESKRCY